MSVTEFLLAGILAMLLGVVCILGMILGVLRASSDALMGSMDYVLGRPSPVFPSSPPGESESPPPPDEDDQVRSQSFSRDAFGPPTHREGSGWPVAPSADETPVPVGDE